MSSHRGAISTQLNGAGSVPTSHPSRMPASRRQKYKYARIDLKQESWVTFRGETQRVCLLKLFLQPTSQQRDQDSLDKLSCAMEEQPHSTENVPTSSVAGKKSPFLFWDLTIWYFTRARLPP